MTKHADEHEHQHGCSCGHEHDHEHEEHECHCHEEHDHECGCGHDHGHDHDHEHAHSHEHEEHECHCHERHDHECGCGHEHAHSHGDGCGCGHGHGHDHGHDHGHEHGDGCCCCEEEEEPPHDHSNDPDLAQYAQDEKDIMRSREEIEREERLVLGHFHGAVGGEVCDECGKDLSQCRCEFGADGVFHAHYQLEHLDCRDCAAKIEGTIRKMAAVRFAAIGFQNKELHIVSQGNPDLLLPALVKACHAIDPRVGIVPTSEGGKFKTVSYAMPSLDCPACAVKLEKLINEQPGVLSATVSYATKQLKLTAEDPDSMIDELVRVCNTVENGTVIEKKVRKTAAQKEQEASEGFSARKLLFPIAFILFVIGMLMEHADGIIPDIFPYQETIIFGIAYLIFGGEILWKAGKNILHGEIFDENFLMSIATLGAVCINEMSEAVGVMMFYRIGEYMEDRASDRSRDQIMEAVDMRPEVVQRVKGDEVETIPAEDAAIGDVLIIRPGDRIPLDGVVIEGDSQLDTSPVSGEPKPVQIHVGDSIDSGCVNQTGTIKIRVEKILAESMVSRILDSVENAVANKPKIDRFITRFSRIYTPLVVAFAILVAVVPPMLFGGDWDHWIYTALTFLVISCPCALVISVPLSFFAGIGAGSKQGILFKGGTSIESASHAKVAVMDKTGTITEGKFKVRSIQPEGALSEDELLALAAGGEAFSTHPIARSIVDAAAEKNLTSPAFTDLHEQAGEGILGSVNGEIVGIGNQRLMARLHVEISENDADDFAGTEIWIGKEGQLLGSIRISDAIKSDAIEAIAELKKEGIMPAMLTGDAPRSAKLIAKQVGIESVHAGLLPQDKLDEMQKIRKESGNVLYVGDGINDAPVLAGADTGAAMGSGADAAIEAADLVFLNSSVSSIPLSVKIAKSVLSTAWQNVIFALAIKVAVMILGLVGFANMWVAVFADVGVTILCILNSIRLLYKKF